MSYKLENTAEEQLSLLSSTLASWSRGEADLQLVSLEGHRVAGHSVVLGMYSRMMSRVLEEQSSPVIVTVPASADTIAQLLRMLVTGKIETRQQEDLDKVKVLAKTLGISMKNLTFDRKKSVTSSSGLTVIKMPSKPSQESKTESTSTPVAKKQKTDSSSMNKSSKATVEKIVDSKSKEYIQKDPEKSPAAPVPILKRKKYPACEVSGCGAVFKDDKFLVKHMEKKHVNKETKKTDTKPGQQSMTVKKETPAAAAPRPRGRPKAPYPNTCQLCGKMFDTNKNLQKHRNNKHPEEAKRGQLQQQTSVIKQSELDQFDYHMKQFTNIEETLVLKNKEFSRNYSAPGPLLAVTMDGSDIILNDPLNDSIVTSDGESYAEDSDASSDRVEIDLCGYCGDKFDDEDSLNLHIASAHCE